jgi:CTP:molybdopterin cytidylyltransferase MocA
MRITGILLAAGMSSRMGQNKLLLRYGQHTVIEESLSQLVSSNVE